jgi:hypothetical protein
MGQSFRWRSYDHTVNPLRHNNVQFGHRRSDVWRVHNRVNYWQGIKLLDWIQVESGYPCLQDSIRRFAEPNPNDPANFLHDPIFFYLAKDASHEIDIRRAL